MGFKNFIYKKILIMYMNEDDLVYDENTPLEELKQKRGDISLARVHDIYNKTDLNYYALTEHERKIDALIARLIDE